MKDTLESLGHKLEMAKELSSVVRTMKALSASSINQYEKAVLSLEDYYQTIKLGLFVCVGQTNEWMRPESNKPGKTAAIVFGAGQGLVGQFNDVLCHYVAGDLEKMPGEKIVWVVGGSVQARLEDLGLPPSKQFEVPNTVEGVTPLVGQLLLDIEKAFESGEVSEIILYYNRPQEGSVYGPIRLRFLPLDEVWIKGLGIKSWPTKKKPEAVNGTSLTLKALIREYLFVTLFRASAKSLTSENASRLAAMQRAEKNIKDLLNDLNLTYHQLRQSSIDEEMFDVIFGSEAMVERSTGSAEEPT
ncbi:MAG: F0F1 ATP synthase subunit gamma [Saprospiraceae bacterium]|nr:F0F1 ATP synthase subunit gamma [Saprospiraceae bacterium]